MKSKDTAAFVELAVDNRKKALDMMEKNPGWGPGAQVYATLYLADMLAAVFSALDQPAPPLEIPVDDRYPGVRRQ